MPLRACVHHVLATSPLTVDTQRPDVFTRHAYLNLRRTSTQDDVKPFTIIEGPAAWRAADLRASPEEWLYHLTTQVPSWRPRREKIPSFPSPVGPLGACCLLLLLFTAFMRSTDRTLTN